VTSTGKEMVKPNSTDFYECVVQALRVSLHNININACEINAEGFFTYRCNVFGKIPQSAIVVSTMMLTNVTMDYVDDCLCRSEQM